MRRQATVDTLIEDLQLVVRDAETLLKATAAQADDKVQDARACAQESLRRAKARLSDIEGVALERADAWAGEAKEYVRANPWQVVATAAGIALLLGLVMSRR